MKANRHKFIVEVKGFCTRNQARTALLVAHGRRQPDECEFRVKVKPPKPSKVIIRYLRTPPKPADAAGASGGKETA